MGVKVRKSLGEVDGAVLEGQAGLFGEDGLADLRQLGGDVPIGQNTRGCM